ncbi:MAG: protein kinase [Gemmatimonadetes bacterium]|nr:protein kinase [Gemmatimonadota bacterium]
MPENTPPNRIAHYEIVERIGAGGMGEVYRARDSKLGRDVALKLLPRDLTGDEERMVRFAREAQVLASLNHPNIGAIYGIEDAEDSKALVLELIEGPTLHERMREGPLPVTEALTIARQIAEAVESAHEKGVVHRDLKPANVMITPGGQVKVLDFGLAKAMAPEEASGSQPSLSLSPTISSPMTAPSVILGTAAYMSPEQARGVPVDKRADIWSFGVILYEMLTGKRLFRGEMVSDILAEVLKTEPDWGTLPPETPARIRRLLKRMLVRDPKQRIHDIGDARIIIDEALAGEEDEIPHAALEAATASATSRGPLPMIAAALAGAVLAAGLAWTLKPGGAPAGTAGGGTGSAQVAKFTTPVETSVRNTRLSPDGRRLAYVTPEGLWVRELDQLKPRLILEEPARGPFWSPDGEWIGYGIEETLYKVRVTGGDPVRIGSVPRGHDYGEASGGVWREDGKIVFSTGYHGLYEISSQGGAPVEILPPGEGEIDFHEVAGLPGDRGLVFVVHKREGPYGLDVWDGIERHSLAIPENEEDIEGPVYSPSGHILFQRRGESSGLWAIPFDLETFAATGEAFLVQSEASHATIRGGTLAFVLEGAVGKGQIVEVDRTGDILRKISEPSDFWGALDVTADGRRIIVARGTGKDELWIYEAERGTSKRFTFDDYRNNMGIWGPNEEFIYFYTINPMNLYRARADGTDEPEFLGPGVLPFLSPDGKYMAHTRLSPDLFGWDIWVQDLEDTAAEPWVIDESDGIDWYSPVSPDGRYIAYQSQVSGKYQIYVTTFPRPGKKSVVSPALGQWVRWSSDGTELFYMANDSLMAVDVDLTGPTFGRPELLFKREMFQWPDAFDVHEDGERFYLIVPHEEEGAEAEPNRIVVVQNWAKEFEQ